MVGKTVKRSSLCRVKERDEDHKAVPDVPELTSLVTITVEDYLEAVAKVLRQRRIDWFCCVCLHDFKFGKALSSWWWEPCVHMGILMDM